MSGQGFYRGTSYEQVPFFADKEKKLIESGKWPAEFERRVDFSRVNMDAILGWVAKRITTLLGVEDEIVIDYCREQLLHQNVSESGVSASTSSDNSGAVCPKKLQINLTGFLGKNAGAFVRDLWVLLLGAQETEGGVPQTIVEDKRLELLEKQREAERIKEALERIRLGGALGTVAALGALQSGGAPATSITTNACNSSNSSPSAAALGGGRYSLGSNAPDAAASAGALAGINTSANAALGTAILSGRPSSAGLLAPTTLPGSVTSTSTVAPLDAALSVAASSDPAAAAAAAAAATQTSGFYPKKKDIVLPPQPQAPSGAAAVSSTPRGRNDSTAGAEAANRPDEAAIRPRRRHGSRSSSNSNNSVNGNNSSGNRSPSPRAWRRSEQDRFRDKRPLTRSELQSPSRRRYDGDANYGSNFKYDNRNSRWRSPPRNCSYNRRPLRSSPSPPPRSYQPVAASMMRGHRRYARSPSDVVSRRRDGSRSRSMQSLDSYRRLPYRDRRHGSPPLYRTRYSASSRPDRPLPAARNSSGRRRATHSRSWSERSRSSSFERRHPAHSRPAHDDRVGSASPLRSPGSAKSSPPQSWGPRRYRSPDRGTPTERRHYYPRPTYCRREQQGNPAEYGERRERPPDSRAITHIRAAERRSRSNGADVDQRRMPSSGVVEEPEQYRRKLVPGLPPAVKQTGRRAARNSAQSSEANRSDSGSESSRSDSSSRSGSSSESEGSSLSGRRPYDSREWQGRVKMGRGEPPPRRRRYERSAESPGSSSRRSTSSSAAHSTASSVSDSGRSPQRPRGLETRRQQGRSPPLAERHLGTTMDRRRSAVAIRDLNRSRRQQQPSRQRLNGGTSTIPPTDPSRLRAELEERDDIFAAPGVNTLTVGQNGPSCISSLGASSTSSNISSLGGRVSLARPPLSALRAGNDSSAVSEERPLQLHSVMDRYAGRCYMDQISR